MDKANPVIIDAYDEIKNKFMLQVPNMDITRSHSASIQQVLAANVTSYKWELQVKAMI